MDNNIIENKSEKTAKKPMVIIAVIMVVMIIAAVVFLFISGGNALDSFGSALEKTFSSESFAFKIVSTGGEVGADGVVLLSEEPTYSISSTLGGIPIVIVGRGDINGYSTNGELYMATRIKPLSDIFALADGDGTVTAETAEKFFASFGELTSEGGIKNKDKATPDYQMISDGINRLANDMKNIEFAEANFGFKTSEESGNTVYSFSLDPEKLATLIKDYGISDEPAFLNSVLTGVIDVTFEENDGRIDKIALTSGDYSVKAELSEFGTASISEESEVLIGKAAEKLEGRDEWDIFGNISF